MPFERNKAPILLSFAFFLLIHFLKNELTKRQKTAKRSLLHARPVLVLHEGRKTIPQAAQQDPPIS